MPSEPDGVANLARDRLRIRACSESFGHRRAHHLARLVRNTSNSGERVLLHPRNGPRVRYVPSDRSIDALVQPSSSALLSEREPSVHLLRERLRCAVDSGEGCIDVSSCDCIRYSSELVRAAEVLDHLRPLTPVSTSKRRNELVHLLGVHAARVTESTMRTSTPLRCSSSTTSLHTVSHAFAIDSAPFVRSATARCSQ